MRESLQRLLRDGTLVTIGFAIAFGFSLYSVAEGANILVTTFLREYPSLDSTGGIGNLLEQFNGGGALTWRVGNRYLTFGALVGGLVEFAVVLAAAAFVYRWRHRHGSPLTTTDDAGDDGGENLAGSGV